MSVLQTDLLSDVQLALAEPDTAGVSWASGLWTPQEVYDATTDTLADLRLRTGIVVTRVDLPVVPNTSRSATPTDWLLTVRAAWRTPDGAIAALSPSTIFEIDHAISTWEIETQPTPLVYADSEVPPNEILVAPASFDGGTISLHYLARGTAITGAAIALDVPDDLVAVVEWGVLARLLSKVGRAQDPPRATYATSRYEGLVTALQVLLRDGWA